MKNWLVGLVVAIIVIGLGVIGFSLYRGYQTTGNKNNNSANVATNSVNIQDFAFSPQNITINKGDTVTWKNLDSATHHIVADDGSFDLGDQQNGSDVTHTFKEAGTFSYHCSIHTSMTGTVTVK